MRRSGCEKITPKQVAQLIARQKDLGLTRLQLIDRFAAALKDCGAVHSPSAAKMRFDRVFNPRMRRPMSDSTKCALARALNWSINDFEKVLQGNGASSDGSGSNVSDLVATLRANARKLQEDARKLESLMIKKRRS